MFLITVVPLSIGMFIRARRTEWAIRSEARAKRLALGLFVFVVGGSIASESEAITDHFGELAIATLTLNLAAMTISFNVARLARLDRRQSTAIAMELGVHNGTVAITVGGRDRDDPRQPRGGLQRLHVHHGGTVRAPHVQAERRRAGGCRRLTATVSRCQARGPSRS